MHYRRICLAIAIFILTCLPSTVSANVGPPSYGGELAGEPNGLAQVEIISEQLTIDLRPLAQGERVEVEVVYQINNKGGAKEVDLIFAADNVDVTDFQLSLNERAVSRR